MATILDLIENLKGLSIQKESVISIAQTADEMAALNRDQLQGGVKSDDSLMPNYSPASVKLFGKPAGRIRLYDTGAFYDSIAVDVSGDNFLFVAEDKHNLIEKYSENILGLGTKQHNYFTEEIFYPVFSERIKEQTGLTFKE